MDKMIEVASVLGQVSLKLAGIWWPVIVAGVMTAIWLDRIEKKEKEAKDLFKAKRNGFRTK